MSTASILKEYIMIDEEAYKLILELEKEKTEPFEITTNSYERGKELLKSFPFR